MLQWGFLADVGTPPTQEPSLNSLDLAIQRTVEICHSSHCQTRSSGFLHSVLSPPRDARNMTGHTGMLGELVGSHTKVAIYPTYAICCERL